MSAFRNFCLFLTAVIVVIIAADYLIYGNGTKIQSELTPETRARIAADRQSPPRRVTPEGGGEYFENPHVVGTPPPDVIAETAPQEPVAKAPVPPPEPNGETASVTPEAPQTPAMPVPVPLQGPKIEGAAKIAIIIDDIGMDVRRSREAIALLPAPVTLAVLPYAPQARQIAKEGKAKGHPLIIHTPMEAVDKSVNIGPGGLKTGMDVVDFTASFQKMLVSFEGYDGINNHMGSGLTQDKEAMDRIMRMLKDRDLFFVDSMTIGNSVGASEAAAKGVPFARRDVFLDHEDTAAFVAGALAKTERIALKRGYAVAIGHPKDHTIAGLRAWIPTLKAKGIELVPVRDLLTKP